jgi:hypothetical protein
MATATTIEGKIDLALEAKIGPLAQSLGLAIAAPGKTYTPDGTNPYLQVILGKNTPVNVAMSGSREPIRRGILLLNVHWRVGSGTLAATEAAAKLREAFKFNTRVDFDGGFVKVTEEPTIHGDIVGDNGYLLVPVTVPWMAFS